MRYRTEGSAPGDHTSSCQFRIKYKNPAETRSGNETNRKQLNPVDPAREQAKKRCSAPGSDRIDRISREREQLSARMQQFYGINKDAADARIDAFANRTEDPTEVHREG